MACYVANSGHDENGKWRYGAAGDQTGTEWHVIPWYRFGQNVVLRHPDRNVRLKIAELARQAAQNDNIGYDQADRMTFYQALKNAGWYPKNIRNKVEADCSSGVLAIVYATGKLLNRAEITNAVDPTGYTGNMRRMLINAGFKALTGIYYTGSGEHLYTGDINLAESSHTNIVVNGADPHDDLLIVDGWIGKYTVRELQKQLGTYMDGIIEGQYIGNQRYLERLESVTWECTGSPCIKALQKMIGAEADGIAGIKTVMQLQKWLNMHSGEYLVVDGYLGNNTACALQRALNKELFKV